MEILNSLISDFSTENLIQLFRHKLNSFKNLEEDYTDFFEEKPEITKNYTNIIKIGEAEIDQTDELLVITAKTLTPLTSRSGKKMQFDIAKTILKTEIKDAAFFIFYDENKNFRFSFIRANYIGAKKDFTDFKRYTYFVSPEQSNKTFISQISKANFADLDSIIEAFSVEPLNKLFYQKIADSFYNLIGGKLNNGNKTVEYNSVLQLPGNDINTNRKIFQEFGVRLIGRTIFVWFLKNKSSQNNVPLIPKNWLTSLKVSQTENYYHALLEKLFFEILNKPFDNRIKNLPEDHQTIPFLNGGLFEPGIDDFYKADKAGFSQFINTLKIPDNWFFELFSTLEQFNFTIDENSISDTEVSIDPEMLGTIFENLLAEIDPDTEKSARKSTGSFYTPREIVDYMTEESLVQYLKSKTDEEEEILHLLFKENDLKPDFFANRLQIIEAFNNIKILDPACGSGAFPMGALHKINTALQKLDPDAQIWKQKQLSKIDNKLYRDALKDKLDKSNVEYIRKLGIIQHSIYGIDIQPIAAEISKLRSFLSLVVDENINDNAQNRGIYPLPNLEFKFVTANTLIGLEEKNEQISLDFGRTSQDIEKLQNIRDEYLQAYGEEKENLKNQFSELQKQIADKEFSHTGTINKKAQQIIGWNPFSHEKCDWFDPKWMFGLENFDLVIGNPPYIQLQKATSGNQKYADLYKNENFETFERTGDIYSLFYEKGINILNSSGILCYITSNKWMRANYGKSLREFFAKKNPLKLIDMGPGVFNTATVDTNILLIANTQQNTLPQNHKLKAHTLKDKNKITALKNSDFFTLENLSDESWIIISDKEQSIKQKIERIGTPLKDWDVNIYRGILTGYNEAFIIDGATKDRLIAADPKNAEILKPILRGRDIKRYKAEFADLWLIFIPWHFPLHDDNSIKGSSNKAELEFEKQYPAIYDYLFQYKNELSNRNKAETGIRYEWYALQRCAASYYDEFEKEKIVWKAIGKNLTFSIEKKDVYISAPSALLTSNYNKYLLAFFQSKFTLYFVLNNSDKTGAGDVMLNVQSLKSIPIPQIPLTAQKPFEEKVNIIIEKKERGENTSLEEAEIDLMVYRLYELTHEEILIIDPEFKMSKEEYEK